MCPELIVNRRMAQHGSVSKGTCTSVTPVSSLKLHLLYRPCFPKETAKIQLPLTCTSVTPVSCLKLHLLYRPCFPKKTAKIQLPLTSTRSWYCHSPHHAPHLDSVLVLSLSSPCPSPQLCLGTIIILTMPLTSTLS
jgi:hypothetical protein